MDIFFSTMSLLRRALPLAGIAAIALVLAGACGGDDPTPTPTPTLDPTPTPTLDPTPTPVPDPLLNLTSDAMWGDVLALIPEADATCIREGTGAAFDLLMTSPVFGDVAINLDDFPLECISPDTVISLLIAGLSQDVQGLSDTSVICLRGAFSLFDAAQLRALLSGESGEEIVDDVMGGLIGALLCLTDEEAENFSIGGLFGLADGALTMQDLRCVIQRVSLDDLLSLFDGFSAGQLDLTDAVDILNALGDCGVDVSGLITGTLGGSAEPGTDALPIIPDLDALGLPPETGEIIACVIAALGADAIQQLLFGAAELTQEQLSSLGECSPAFEGDIDVAQILELLGQ